MPIPYSPDAVAALRHAAATNVPAAEIQQHLGWDGPMLTRVCQKHGIYIMGAIPPTPQVEMPPPRVAMLDPLRVFAGNLSGQAGIALTRLIRRPIGERVSSADMGFTGTSGCSAGVARANRAMERSGIPWRIKSAVGRNCGFWLERIGEEGAA